MKLYYSAGTCSLAAHIVAREAGIALELERVDIRKTPHVTASGDDFSRINPKGYVPVLQLDDGFLLSEGAAIVQYLADLKPESGLAPRCGSTVEWSGGHQCGSRRDDWYTAGHHGLTHRDSASCSQACAGQPKKFFTRRNLHKPQANCFHPIKVMPGRFA